MQYRANLRNDIFWNRRFSHGQLLFRIWNWYAVIFGVAAICWFVLAVELTLYWNSINSVYNISSTGQLIPFIVGLLGFVRVTHLAIMTRHGSVSLPHAAVKAREPLRNLNGLLARHQLFL